MSTFNFRLSKTQYPKKMFQGQSNYNFSILELCYFLHKPSDSHKVGYLQRPIPKLSYANFKQSTSPRTTTHLPLIFVSIFNIPRSSNKLRCLDLILLVETIVNFFYLSLLCLVPVLLSILGFSPYLKDYQPGFSINLEAELVYFAATSSHHH